MRLGSLVNHVCECEKEECKNRKRGRIVSTLVIKRHGGNKTMFMVKWPMRRFAYWYTRGELRLTFNKLEE